MDDGMAQLTMRNAEFGVRNEKPKDLQERTKRFAINIWKFVVQLPHNREIDILAKQLLRAGTSVGANYRAACRAKSRADFIAKLGIVEEEADEARFWLELFEEISVATLQGVQELLKESDAILAMTISSINTARKMKG